MKLKPVTAIILPFFLFACSHNQHSDKVGAKLTSQSGKEIGWIKFDEKGEVVTVKGKFKNLKPNAKMGMHIHENGDCSNNFQNAGSHFDPTYKIHGHPKSDATHAGDLGNLTTNKSGRANYSITKDDLSLEKDEYNSIIGKSVIIHSGTDDFKTQPSGGSGEKFACGVIERI